jgi:iron complex outermembrane receptor protein
VSENIQVFGLINNLFNNRNATYGTFFERGTGAQAALATNFTTNPQTITPMAPLSLYAGFKVTF